MSELVCNCHGWKYEECPNVMYKPKFRPASEKKEPTFYGHTVADVFGPPPKPTDVKGEVEMTDDPLAKIKASIYWCDKCNGVVSTPFHKDQTQHEPLPLYSLPVVRAVMAEWRRKEIVEYLRAWATEIREGPIWQRGTPEIILARADRLENKK